MPIVECTLRGDAREQALACASSTRTIRIRRGASQLLGLEWKAGHEQALNKRRRRHQFLVLQVEDPLQALIRDAAQVRKFCQQPRERVRVMLRLIGRREVLPQGADQVHLELLDLGGLLQTWTV